MALDRWIAIAFMLICLIYGYSAFFIMDLALPPFMQRNPVWPSTMPKLLTILGILASLVVLITNSDPGPTNEDDIDYRNLQNYNLVHALILILLMVAYAISLRPIGFLVSTSVFLAVGGYVLGERKLHILIPVAAVAAGLIWYLVQEVLGIFLRPLPWFWGG